MRKRSSPLGPGGKLLTYGFGGLVVFFVLWQFVVPFFFGNSNPGSENKGQASTTTTGTPKPELEGAIVNPDGRPLEAAVIQKADGTKVATVDASGQFSIPKLPGDKDKLVVVAPGYEPAPLPLTKEAAKAVQLKPRVLTGTLVDSESQQPIANRLVRGGNEGVITDAAGKFTFSGLPAGAKVRVDLVGYEQVEKTLDDSQTDLTLSVRSTSFSGSLTDAKTGKPIPNALVKNNEVSAISGQDGKFTFSDLKRDENTTLKVRAPGYKLQSFKATELAKGVKMEPFVVRGVYVPGVFAIRANYNELFTPYLKMAERGEINAIVVDMKNDDNGLLWYDSQVPIARELGLITKKGADKEVLIDLPKMLEESHKRGLYVIARYVVMRDPAIAKAKPEWALKNNRTGGPWQDNNKLVWPNQFVPEIGDYNAALAKELAGYGFDEIQYDYIRFPTDGVLKEIQYKPDLNWTQLSQNEKLRTQTINGIVKKAYDVLRTSDTFLSLDVFGMSLWREDDNNIGQQYDDLVMLSDYICPMVYPSHFEIGTLDLKKYPGHPGQYPGVIMEQSGVIASKLEAKLKPIAKYRPWLEDFGKTWGTPIIKHSPERLRLQIEAADKTGQWGWTIWNAAGVYSNSVLAARAKNGKS